MSKNLKYLVHFVYDDGKREKHGSAVINQKEYMPITPEILDRDTEDLKELLSKELSYSFDNDEYLTILSFARFEAE